MSGPTTVEAKLARKPEQWRGGVPETMAAGSPAAVLYALKDAKHDVLLLLDALTQERELRKAAEGERDEAIRLARDRGSDITIDVTSTIAKFRSRAADLEAQLAQLRKDAVDVVKPFAFDGLTWTHGDRVVTSMLIRDIDAGRISLNANDQGTNDGR